MPESPRIQTYAASDIEDGTVKCAASRLCPQFSSTHTAQQVEIFVAAPLSSLS